MTQETEISEITEDTVVACTKCCTVGKPGKSKEAPLEYSVTLQAWNISGYLTLPVYAIIKLLIIMLYYANTFILLHILIIFSLEFLQNCVSVLGLTADGYLNRFLVSNS